MYFANSTKSKKNGSHNHKITKRNIASTDQSLVSTVSWEKFVTSLAGSVPFSVIMPGLSMPTFFSSRVGGDFKRSSSGA